MIGRVGSWSTRPALFTTVRSLFSMPLTGDAGRSEIYRLWTNTLSIDRRSTIAQLHPFTLCEPAQYPALRPTERYPDRLTLRPSILETDQSASEHRSVHSRDLLRMVWMIADMAVVGGAKMVLTPLRWRVARPASHRRGTVGQGWPSCISRIAIMWVILSLLRRTLPISRGV